MNLKQIMWPGLLIVLIASVVIVDVTMLIVATRDPSIALTDGYLAHRGASNPDRSQTRENDRLSWAWSMPGNRNSRYAPRSSSASTCRVPRWCAST